MEINRLGLCNYLQLLHTKISNRMRSLASLCSLTLAAWQLDHHKFYTRSFLGDLDVKYNDELESVKYSMCYIND